MHTSWSQTLLDYPLAPMAIILFHLGHWLPKETKVVEINVLIILGYFIIFGVSALTTFGVTLWNGQNFRKVLVSYFLCESTDTSGDKVCSGMGIWQFSTPIPIAVTLLLFGLYPVVNLVYAVQIQELKQKL